MITIRTATSSDLPGILRVEESWPADARAGADKFMSRMEKFGAGFFVASVQDGERGEVPAATITAMPLTYQPEAPHAFSSWDRVTNDGYLRAADLSACNALYIVSGVIDTRYRGLNIFTPMVLREVELAQRLGLRYVLAGAVIPGYRKFCERHGETSAYAYCRTRRGQHLVDPLLAMYEAIGFAVPDADHVLKEYYPDDASRNYAALVMRDLHTHPFIAE